MLGVSFIILQLLFVTTICRAESANRFLEPQFIYSDLPSDATDAERKVALALQVTRYSTGSTHDSSTNVDPKVARKILDDGLKALRSERIRQEVSDDVQWWPEEVLKNASALLDSSTKLKSQLAGQCGLKKMTFSPSELDSSTEADACYFCVDGTFRKAGVASDQIAARMALVEKVTKIIHDLALIQEWMVKTAYKDKNTPIPNQFFESRIVDSLSRYQNIPNRPEPALNRNAVRDLLNYKISQFNEDLTVATLIGFPQMTKGSEPNPTPDQIRMRFALMGDKLANSPLFEGINEQRTQLMSHPLTSGARIWEDRFKNKGQIVAPVSDREIDMIFRERIERFRSLQSTSKAVLSEIQALRIGTSALPANLRDLRAAVYSEHALRTLWKYYPQLVYRVVASNPELASLTCDAIKRADELLDPSPSPVMAAWQTAIEKYPWLPAGFDLIESTGGAIAGALAKGGLGFVLGAGTTAVIRQAQYAKAEDDRQKRINSRLIHVTRFTDQKELVTVTKEAEEKKDSLNRSLTDSVVPKRVGQGLGITQFLYRNFKTEDKDTLIPISTNMRYLEALRDDLPAAQLAEKGALSQGIFKEINLDRQKRGNLSWSDYAQALQKEIDQGLEARARALSSGKPVPRSSEKSATELENYFRDLYRKSLASHPYTRGESTPSGLVDRLLHMKSVEDAQLAQP